MRTNRFVICLFGVFALFIALNVQQYFGNEMENRKAATYDATAATTTKTTTNDPEN